MTSKLTSPKWPGLPSPPLGDFFNETQWTVLLSLLDAIVPSLVPASKLVDPLTQKAIPDEEFTAVLATTRKTIAESPDEETLEKYLAELPSKNEQTVFTLRRALDGVPDSARRQLGGVLSALA